MPRVYRTKTVIAISPSTRADLVAHGPSRLIRAEAHIAPNLRSAHSLLTGQHEMDDAIPVSEWYLRILKDRPCYVGKAISCKSSRGAFSALPMPFTGREVIDSRISTPWAIDHLLANAVRPDTPYKPLHRGTISRIERQSVDERAWAVLLWP